jgi:hypothetical protein
VCDHSSSIEHLASLPVTLFPNFVFYDDKHEFSHESLHYGLYVYVGGDVAIERALINKFTAELIHDGLSIHGVLNSLNQEALNNDHFQLGEVDPHTLSRILYRYLFIQMYLSMGISSVCTPAHVAEHDLWAWKEFPRVLSCFTYLWMNHKEIIGPCNDQCSSCLVVDGHQKCRRRICGFKDVRIDTEEMKQIVIGCCRTPVTNSKYCQTHKDLVCDSTVVVEQQDNTIKKSLKRLKLSLRERKKKKDKLDATSCTTNKERSDDYVRKCIRSFGLIAVIYNCKIITGFSELFRSETLKEIINLFCACIRGMSNDLPEYFSNIIFHFFSIGSTGTYIGL